MQHIASSRMCCLAVASFALSFAKGDFVRQCDLSPVPSPIACRLRIAARIAYAAPLLVSSLVVHTAERPHNPLAWRNYTNELEDNSERPGKQEIDAFQSSSLMHLPLSIPASQPRSALILDVSSPHAPNWNDQTISFPIVAEHSLPKTQEDNATLINFPFFLQMSLRKTAGVETTASGDRCNDLLESRRNSSDGVSKSALPYFNDRPWITEIAASPSMQGNRRTLPWEFLPAAAFLFGIALLGVIWVSIGKRSNHRGDRRRISDAYLKRARAIARFGSYRIRIPKDAQQESNRWSQEMYSILRREPAQGPMRTSAYIARYVHPEDRSFVTEIYRKAIAGNSVDCEYRIIVPGGEVRYVHDFLECVSSDSAKKVFLGQMHDVTERRRMQQELDQTRAELRRSLAALESLRGKEQKRVAQEMHDDLGQLLAAMKIDLDDLGQSLPSNDTKLQRRLLALKELVGTMIVSVRRIVADLPPKGLEDLGLFEALTLMKQSFESRHRIPCLLKLPQEQPSLDRGIASAIYRTVQESLSNIVKHANATLVSVELTADEHHITVCVIDNGKGLSPDASQKTDSFGLIGMRERSIALDGEMKLESGEGRGTVVRVRLPTGQA